ncbi:MAG TPA: HEAT repeat domain-containing protein, partial [Kofleriaceae bacterium]|nr:HEAT repeat domain-containing protein [Kofleriaceae bacterium]
FVEAEAALSLGKTRTVRAGEVLRLAASRDSFNDVVRQYAYRGLAEARDDSALGLLVEAVRWGRVTQGRRAAAMALANLMRGRRDREARDVRERLELLLADRDFRVQAAAIEALAIVADPAAIGALRQVIDRELDGRLRRRSKEVIRNLEDATSAAEDVRRLRDEVSELRALTASLRDRLDRMTADDSPPAAPDAKHGKKRKDKADKPAKVDKAKRKKKR